MVSSTSRPHREINIITDKNTPFGFGDFKIGEQIIYTVKYADDIVLVAKEGKVLQDVIDKVIEIGGCYGMEMNVEKNKSNGNFKTTFVCKNCDRTKATRECGIF